MGSKPSKVDSYEDTVTAIPSHRMRRSPVNTPASRRDWSLISFPLAGADLSRVLSVQEVDMMMKKNRRAHQTKHYHKSLGLLVRRGHAFTLRIVCNRARDERDGILLAFSFKDDESPSLKKPTLVFLQVYPQDKRSSWNGWTAKLLEDETGENEAFMVEVTPSVKCIIGFWYLCVDTYLVERPKMARRHKEKIKIFTLFNAWSKDDPVYMSEEDKRNEYVIEDAGHLYIGSSSSNYGMSWTFDQYRPEVLKVVMFLLKKSWIKWKERSDPIAMTRMLATMVNKGTREGLLEGRWKGGYDDGTSPMAWPGSGDIYSEYYKTKIAVKYGQCSTFAGILTTACRVLGIPSRPVSAFNPGVDANQSLMVETYVDKNNKRVESEPNEITWNYHVWCEAWMARGDLNDPQYDGWQALDGTPAMEPYGVYRGGPCSVAAVKKGEVNLNYDTLRMLGTTNADKVTWLVQGKDKPYRVIDVATDAIANKITTKAVGSEKSEDVAFNYKHKEGSRGEDSQMHKAWLLKGIEMPHFERQQTATVEAMSLPIFSFKDEETVLLLGKPFSVVLKVENPVGYDKKQKVMISMRMDATDYTGMVMDEIMSRTFTADIYRDQTFALEATYWEYEKALGEKDYVLVQGMIYVPDIDYYRPVEKKIRIAQPPLLMTTSGSEEKGVEMTVDVRIENTLPKQLTNGYIKITGTGISSRNLVKNSLNRPVAPSEYAEDSFKVTPTRRGRVYIKGQFYSPEVGYVTGYQVINVK